MLPDGGHELSGRDPGAQVDDRKAGALQQHADQVLADVVQVAFDRAQHDGAQAGALALTEMRFEGVEGALHGARAEQHLGDEALAGAHARADHLHAGQQGVVQDLASRRAGGQQRLGQGVHQVGVAGDQGLRELLLHLSPPQPTPARRSVSSTMAWMRALTSSSNCSGW